MEYTQLPFIEKVKTNQKEFGNKVISIAQKLGVPAAALMIVMNNESGLNSAIKNPNSSASGLIQFIESTAKELGTTTAKLRAMSNVEQLDYVYKYMNTYKGKLKDTADVYLAVFFPVALYKNLDWEFPNWAVVGNPIFDINKDGTLTKQEFKNYVYNKYKKYIPNEFTPAVEPTTQPESEKQIKFWTRYKKPILITAGGLLALTLIYYATKDKSNTQRKQLRRYA